MGDDLGWKAMAFVADRLGHSAVLTPEALTKSYRDTPVADLRKGVRQSSVAALKLAPLELRQE
jgi:hypothetical protein